MTDGWQERVDAFWAAFDDREPERMLAEMRALVAERGDDDPRALAEWGGVHDSLGLEGGAVEPYRAALAGGLDPETEHQVTLQLASTLRNLGEHDEAVRLLRGLDAPELGDAPAAFLALALHGAGRVDEAVAVAVAALAPHLPRYGRAAAAYAAELAPS